MFGLQSITSDFASTVICGNPNGSLWGPWCRRSCDPVLGILAKGQSLAMAHTTTVQHAIKHIGRFWGNRSID